MKLRAGGVGVFYFAGHGMQVGGKNYLIPVNASMTVEPMFKGARVDVRKATSGQQTPWESSSLTGNFFFSLPD